MIEYVGIVIGVVCVIAIGVVGYFLYKRVSTQQTTIDKLIDHQRQMEAAFFRPPPRQEISSLYDRPRGDDCNSCILRPYDDSRDKNQPSKLESKHDVTEHVVEPSSINESINTTADGKDTSDNQ